jgi:hypothetical protein
MWRSFACTTVLLSSLGTAAGAAIPKPGTPQPPAPAAHAAAEWAHARGPNQVHAVYGRTAGGNHRFDVRFFVEPDRIHRLAVSSNGVVKWRRARTVPSDEPMAYRAARWSVEPHQAGETLLQSPSDVLPYVRSRVHAGLPVDLVEGLAVLRAINDLSQEQVRQIGPRLAALLREGARHQVAQGRSDRSASYEALRRLLAKRRASPR